MLNETAYFRETQLVRSNARLDPTVLGPVEYTASLRQPDPRPAVVHPDSGYVAEQRFGAKARTQYTVATANEDYYQSANFVRLREVSIAYTLPPEYLHLFQEQDLKCFDFRQGGFRTWKLWTSYQGSGSRSRLRSLVRSVAKISPHASEPQDDVTPLRLHLLTTARGSNDRTSDARPRAHPYESGAGMLAPCLCRQVPPSGGTTI